MPKAHDVTMKCCNIMILHHKKSRIGTTTSAIRAIQRNVSGSRELSNRVKVEVYNAMEKPMVMYGCESWVLRETEKTRLQATEISV